MKFTNYLSVSIILAFLLIGCNGKEETPKTSAKSKPNIILIMTDDQGNGDFGFAGNPDIKTPTLDSLAKKSTRFTNFYVSPVCAPTRSSLMTGRYSLRTGVWDTYNGGAIMASNEVTIAEVLSENGYNTGVYGKWHLGDTYPHRPSDQGFKESLVHGGGGIGQVGDYPNTFKNDSSYFDPILMKNDEEYQSKGYCSDVFTDHAIEFIKSNADNPFFVYLAFNAPHTPLQLPKKYYDMYKDLQIDSSNYDNGPRNFPVMNEGNVRDAQRVYGMVSNIDDNLNRLFQQVNASGIRDNTIIIFLTDNGPQQIRYTNGLRGRKGMVYEGGIRVPFFISQPGVFEEDKEIEEYAAHFDVLPTLMDILGLQPSEKADGKSILPLIEGKQTDWAETRPIISYWQRGIDHPYQNVSVRKGDFKLVGNVAFDAEIEEFELFNLANDRAELNNIVTQNKDKANELRTIFDEFYSEIKVEPNLVNGPRIIIGNDNQKSVTLNRNDAKGPPGIWGQRDRYMYWDVTVEETGLYDIKIDFWDTVKAGNLTLRASTVMITKDFEDQNSKSLHFTDTELLKGEYKIDSWLRDKRDWRILNYPFKITIEKK